MPVPCPAPAWPCWPPARAAPAAAVEYPALGWRPAVAPADAGAVDAAADAVGAAADGVLLLLLAPRERREEVDRRPPHADLEGVVVRVAVVMGVMLLCVVVTVSTQHVEFDVSKVQLIK